VSIGFSTRVGQVAVVVLMAEPGEGEESASVSGEDARECGIERWSTATCEWCRRELLHRRGAVTDLLVIAEET
jgi:hypothetical protein